ncbi:serine/arginine repetitive matrix protein 1-like isoform X2 [Physella acuta]|uniref:serine/arginine repetitive matrix protein 1-like isoform X2 n=1 Tax=Physella acuta TaxID=109671 RepID=UPI0027DCFF5D|nr:serine/arginine repetitive matrix protein 1-like isoform X2 [Physella acuta]
MPQDRGHRRKHSRSHSPVPTKHKRSWQNDVPGGRGRGGRPMRHRSPSPLRREKKHFKASPKFNSRKDFRGPSPIGRKSRSPHKRPRPRSPYAGRPLSPLIPRHPQLSSSRDPNMGSGTRLMNERENSVLRPQQRPQQRSLSPRPPPKAGTDRLKNDPKFTKNSSAAHSESALKKKSHSSVSPPPKRLRSQTPPNTSSLKRSDPQPLNQRSGSIPERKVSSSSKKKPARMTLHKRFTLSDQEPFELEENVTIAILRNPNAEPSEDVTVKKVFDSTLFKMVHKKTEGRKPIFDREEIKIWRHDENFADDPDFERRLVRVKSTSAAPKVSSDSLSRMSPDVIRKAFGRQIGVRSRSKSPHRDAHLSRSREPEIRLDPRPDPRYESKFREQLEREEGKKRRDTDQTGTTEKRVNKSENREAKRTEDRRGERNERGKPEPYDLRQALERRRNDRVDVGFRIEVQRGELDTGTELFYRGSSVENTRNFADYGGRNVVVDQDREQRRFGSLERGDSRSSWDNDRRTVRRRGRGGVRTRGKFGRRAWSPEADKTELDMRRDDLRDGRNRGFDHRPRYSTSPTNTRGWRGGYRGRGRGRGRDFPFYDQEISSPTDIDDSFKYTQHDDRDISPRTFHPRGRRFPSRGFGSSGFRMNGRSGFRGGPGGGRGYRGGYKGGLGSVDDRRSLDRRNTSLDREWKHDMYDTLQAEESQSHTANVGS